MGNTQTAHQICEAFGRGDVPTILDTLDATHQGRHYSFPNNGHLGEFNSVGKVIRFDHVTDTAQMIRLARVE